MNLFQKEEDSQNCFCSSRTRGLVQFNKDQEFICLQRLYCHYKTVFFSLWIKSAFQNASSYKQSSTASVAQWLEHWSCKPGVESSILSRGFLQSAIYFDFHYKYWFYFNIHISYETNYSTLWENLVRSVSYSCSDQNSIILPHS